MLTASLGISSSSMYAAYGSKAELFNEAVRTYAQRYSLIYERAVNEPTLLRVIERILIDSVHEFSRTDEGHPGCLISSAAMSDAPLTLDVRAYVDDLQRHDEERLRERIKRAVLDGDVASNSDSYVLADLVQTLWQGLSVRSNLGADRHELLAVAQVGAALIAR